MKLNQRAPALSLNSQDGIARIHIFMLALSFSLMCTHIHTRCVCRILECHAVRVRCTLLHHVTHVHAHAHVTFIRSCRYIMPWHEHSSILTPIHSSCMSPDIHETWRYISRSSLAADRSVCGHTLCARDLPSQPSGQSVRVSRPCEGASALRICDSRMLHLRLFLQQMLPMLQL